MSHGVSGWLGRRILDYLDQPIADYEPFIAPNPGLLLQCLEPGDVLLVDGNTRLSVVIKYLTQSTWSHAALYIGDALDKDEAGVEPKVLVEALAHEGVIASPLSKYAHFNTRICRPVHLSADDRRKVIDFAMGCLGRQYDVRQVVDLARYLIPHPPVPVAQRRRMLALGSGDPTRAICSTLIAQAFQSIRYPILPEIGYEREVAGYGVAPYARREILHIRNHGLFAPRDFDVSPYFAVVKPTIQAGFDYRRLTWAAP